LLASSNFSVLCFSAIRGGPYADITVPETENINDAWDFLYHGWLLRSMFYCAEKVCYEEYVFL
ncbi:MAG TPA: hypothetical protein VHY08_07575, partial [Bacillota bacterium]|nr:hypothetical protein [Bacillota bacterium]